MRHLASLLFVANVLWCVWVFLGASKPAVDAPSARTETEYLQSPQKLQLLSEREIGVGAAFPESANEQPEDGGANSAENEGTTFVGAWCGESEPVGLSPQVEKAEEQWKQLGGTVQVFSTTEQVSSTWWVYLPNVGGEENAKALLTELQSKKIDSYFMRSGDLAGGISLGVFSRQPSALGVQSDLLKKGYKAEVKQVPRMEPRAKLVLRVEGADRLVIQQYLNTFGDAFSLHEIPCK